MMEDEISSFSPFYKQNTFCIDLHNSHLHAKTKTGEMSAVTRRYRRSNQSINL